MTDTSVAVIGGGVVGAAVLYTLAHRGVDATLLEADSALAALRVDGGLSRSETLMQAQADLLQIPVERYPMADATALGVAALARLGAGAAGSPAEAVGTWTPAAVFEPRMSAEAAAARLARFRAAEDALISLAAAAPSQSATSPEDPR